MQLTILMPCLNERETLAACIGKAKNWIASSGLDAEVLVADNGSADGSQEIATALGARVVDAPEKGYGSALFHGAQAARGEWIIMGDSDDSYDFGKLDLFVERLAAGYDLVMGNRFTGGIAPGAMPWKNRYIGNPLLSLIGRVLFHCPVGDFHCGLRAFTKAAFLRMDLRTTGMEFASEMVIKATLRGLKICEVPTTLGKDGRSRPPHLRPWRDGWRHLRFMLLFSPRWLFVIPGLILLLLSVMLYVPILLGPVRLGNVSLDVHTLLFAQSGITLGLLAVLTGVIVRLIGIRDGLLQKRALLERLLGRATMEVGGIIGIGCMCAGFVCGCISLSKWASLSFGPLFQDMLRLVSFATLLFSVGGIILTTSLVIGFLALPMRNSES